MALPLRDRNALMLAAGFAPAHATRGFDDSAMAPARATLEVILHAHLPHPALAVDRHWQFLAAKAAVPPLIADVAEPTLLVAPIKCMRLALHPGGLAPRIANLAEWRAHLLERLRRQVEAKADPALAALLAELAAPEGPVPLCLDTPAGPPMLISTTTMFGTAGEVTLSERTTETFFPADAYSAARLRRLCGDATAR